MTASLRSRRAFFAVLALGLPLVVAEACGSSSPPVQTGANGDAGPALHPDSGPSNSGDAQGGGADGSTTTDSAVLDALGAGDAAPDVTPDHADAGPPLPICSPDASVGSASTLVLSTPDPDLMGGISDDNLVIAWTSIPDDAAAPVVYWAERSQASAAFGAPQTLDSKFGVVAPDHVALRGDGLRLVFVSADRTHLYEVGRTAYGTPFETDDTNENFQGVNPTTEGSSGNPGLSPFGSPSLGSSFTTMWAFIQGNAGFVISQSDLGVWSTPAWQSSLTPPASGRFSTLPTGWSIDGRTLFYWDSANAVERAAWRDYSSLAFTSTNDIGTVQQYAVPSADCTQLYFSAPGSGGDLDIFVSSIQ